MGIDRTLSPGKDAGVSGHTVQESRANDRTILHKAASIGFRFVASSLRSGAKAFYTNIDKDPGKHEDNDANVWSPPRKAVGRKARMKLRGVFSNEEEETQPCYNSDELQSVLMATIKEQIANSPHCVYFMPAVRVESNNAKPCVDASAPSLDVEIPDPVLYYSPVVRQLHAQDFSPKCLNGTRERHNSEEDEASPFGNDQLHHSKTNDGQGNRFLRLTSPPPSPKRENALPKAASANFTSPDVPSMGSPSTWKWSDRNQRYNELDQNIDTASDTESDPDLTLVRSPATIKPVTAHNLLLLQDRKGKDKVAPSPAMHDIPSAKDSPSDGFEDFTFADMPYSLPLSRVTISEDVLEKADSVTSTTPVVDESEDLAVRVGSSSALVPLLWDGVAPGSDKKVKPVTSTDVQMDESEDFAALGDMPYNVPLSQDMIRKDKLGRPEPVTPITKLNRPLSSFTNLAHLVQCPPSGDSSMGTTSSCAITTHDDLCYDSPSLWPKFHVREEVASVPTIDTTKQQTAWSELPFDPDINMKHTLEPLSPTKVQESKAPNINMKHTLESLSPTKAQEFKAPNTTSGSRVSSSALPYRLKSTSPSGLSNNRAVTGSKDRPRIKIRYESEDTSFQDSGTSTEKSFTPPGTKDEGSPTSKIATKCTIPGSSAEKPYVQSTVCTTDCPPNGADRPCIQLPGPFPRRHRPFEYLPAGSKVKHSSIPDIESLDRIARQAAKIDPHFRDLGLVNSVSNTEHASTSSKESSDSAEAEWRSWMDDSVDHSRDGFPVDDGKGVSFERDPALLERFAVRHYRRDARLVEGEEDGVVGTEDGAVEKGDGVVGKEEGLTAWDDDIKKRVAEHLLKVVYDLEAAAGKAARAA